MRFRLEIWRQPGPETPGAFEAHEVEGVSPDETPIEVLERLNATLLAQRRPPIAFEAECRRGACGLCAMVINGRPHGPSASTATCQQPMRAFPEGSTLVIEPWRARPFPPARDLIADRGAIERALETAGLPRLAASRRAMNPGVCIECGACAAACPNASAALLAGARVADPALPDARAAVTARALVAALDAEGFGACSNHGACATACPKAISLGAIAALNRAYLWGRR